MSQRNMEGGSPALDNINRLAFWMSLPAMLYLMFNHWPAYHGQVRHWVFTEVPYEYGELATYAAVFVAGVVLLQGLQMVVSMLLSAVYMRVIAR